jgi:competence protein ComEC
LFASLLAGLATTPFAAFHFHRLAPYGVIANLLAMPIVSAIVMPAGMLALVAMPFGFDAPLWRLMAMGLDWMILVARWVGDLPGAVGRIGAFGTGILLICTIGFLIVCLLRTPLRWVGVALMLIACVMIVGVRQPDILVAPDGEAFAVRGTSGQLAIKTLANDPIAIKEWLAADADARLPADAKLGDGFTCDEIGCVAKLANGTLVAVAQSPEAFADDCERAAVIVTPRQPPRTCAALVVSRTAWRDGGALALYRHGDGGWDIVAARPSGLDRPWAPAADRNRRPLSQMAPDATPRPEDLEDDD